MFDGLQFIAGIAAGHSQGEPAFGHKDTVLCLRAQLFEGLLGILVTPQFAPGGGQFIERVTVEGRIGRGTEDRSERRRLLRFVPQQSQGQALAVVGVNLVVGAVIVAHLAVGADGGLVVLLREIAVGAAGHRIFTEFRPPVRAVGIQPFRRLRPVLLAEVAVGDIVSEPPALGRSGERRRVVELRQLDAGRFIVAAAVKGFRHPVAGKLAQPVILGQIVGGRLVVGSRLPPGAAAGQLVGPQVIGLDIVALLFRAQFVDIVIGADSALVVFVDQRGERHIGINLFPAHRRAVFLDVTRETLRALVQVEGEFGVIEPGILADVRAPPKLRGRLVVLQGLHVVAQRHAGRRHIVFGNLSQGILALRHVFVVLQRSLVVVGGVEHGARVEPVGAGHVGGTLDVFFEIAAGRRILAADQQRFGKHTGQVRAAFAGSGLEHRRPLFGDIGVIPFQEFAFQHIVGGDIADPGVPRRLPEAFARRSKLSVRIVHQAEQETRLRGISGNGPLFQRVKTAPGGGIIAERIGAIALLEDQFGNIGLADILRIHLSQFRAGLRIFPFVEKVQGVAEADFGIKGGGGIVPAEVIEHRRIVRRLAADGAEQGIPAGARALGRLLEELPRLRIEALAIQVQRLPLHLQGTGPQGQGAEQEKQRKNRGPDAHFQMIFKSYKNTKSF